MIQQDARWWRELGVQIEGLLPAGADVTAPPAAKVLPQRQVPPAPAGIRNEAQRRGPSLPPVSRVAPQRPLAPEPATPTDSARAGRIAGLAWAQLPEAIAACTACSLCRHRQHSVPGAGGAAAPWLFVADGPDAGDDATGAVLGGSAGALFDNMLVALGLARGDQVFITQALKCRLPEDRQPDGGQVAACLPFLERQIALLQPAVIVALGKTAAQALLGSNFNVRSLRGRAHNRDGLPVVVTFHPAFLLDNPAEKARSWEDLCLARSLVQAAGARGSQPHAAV